MNKKTWLIFIVLLASIVGIVLIGASGLRNDGLLTRHGLDQMSVQDIVLHLENKLDEKAGFGAAITGSKLLLSDEKEQLELNLPTGLFYLSIAPYVHQTHPCATHNLVSCRGELKNESFQIEVRDIDSNTLVIDTVMSTMANGFAGIWLPKDRNYQITITYNTLSATTQVSTGSTSDTCLTTMKLS